MGKQKIAALGLIFISGAFFLTHLPGETGNKKFLEASFSSNGSQVANTYLEVAETEQEKRKGLMNRTELGKNEGMVFIYSDEKIRTFWMKNTLIPLDMIFLNEDREVINVETAYPEPDTADENLKVYSSERPAKYVIEVNAGFTDNHSIGKGTEVTWNR